MKKQNRERERGRRKEHFYVHRKMAPFVLPRKKDGGMAYKMVVKMRRGLGMRGGVCVSVCVSDE